MGLSASFHAAAAHRMRAYYVPAVAGMALAASAFLPWVFVGTARLGGVPDLASFWVLGLGLLATGLASASIVTRKNSRHPILLVGLTALAVLALAHRLMERSASEHAWAVAQAVAIVDGVPADVPPETTTGAGLYLGLGASLALVLFGLTIVMKPASTPYAHRQDDDA